jgi:hypothetical protein
MIKQIDTIEMPTWLNEENVEFDIRKLLEDSLYYPCAGFDGDPIKYFMGNIYSFIYVDYNVSKEELEEKIENVGFAGYKCIQRKSIPLSHIIPNNWRFIKPENNDFSINNSYPRDKNIKPFCEWFIFERDKSRDDSYNPARFSLIYLCEDAVKSYQALYLMKKIKPKITSIIQPGDSWTEIKNRNSIFARSIFYDKNLLPDFIIHGGGGPFDFYEHPLWNEYNEFVIKFETVTKAKLSIWKIGKKI